MENIVEKSFTEGYFWSVSSCQFIQLGYLLWHLFSVQFIRKKFFFCAQVCIVFWAVRNFFNFCDNLTDFQFSPGSDTLWNVFVFSSKCHVMCDWTCGQNGIVNIIRNATLQTLLNLIQALRILSLSVWMQWSQSQAVYWIVKISSGHRSQTTGCFIWTCHSQAGEKSPESQDYWSVYITHLA